VFDKLIGTKGVVSRRMKENRGRYSRRYARKGTPAGARLGGSEIARAGTDFKGLIQKACFVCVVTTKGLKDSAHCDYVEERAFLYSGPVEKKR